MPQNNNNMDEPRQPFIDAGTPGGRFMISVATTFPFYFINWGFYWVALNTPDILAALDPVLLKTLLVTQTLAILLEFALGCWMWPQRHQTPLRPQASLLLTHTIGLNYIILAILTGPFTSPISLLVVGFLAPGLLLFNLRIIVITFAVCMLPLAVNDILLMKGLVHYAPLLGPGVLQAGSAAAAWWSALKNYAFYASILMNGLTTFFMFHRLDSQRLRLKQLSITDSLTGLFNRRHFMEKLATETRRRERYGRPFSVVICDVDHFKRINDTHGHDVGDDVLCHIARHLSQGLRGTDTVARLGGEEFALLMPETPTQAAHSVCARIADAIRGHEFTTATGRFRVTISMGIFECAAGSGEEALQKADTRLYAAKSQGRDRIVCAEPAR